MHARRPWTVLVLLLFVGVAFAVAWLVIPLAFESNSGFERRGTSEAAAVDSCKDEIIRELDALPMSLLAFTIVDVTRDGRLWTVRVRESDQQWTCTIRHSRTGEWSNVRLDPG